MVSGRSLPWPTNRSFAELLGAIMAPLAPGIRMPEDLLEIRNMLASRAEGWKQQLLQEGRQNSEAEG